MTFTTSQFATLAQAVQTEYLVATGLVVAMVLLGLLAVCIPRKRAKHFIEPEDDDKLKKSKKTKR